MDAHSHEQNLESGLPGVFEIPGEPAIVINGVPDVAPTSDGTLINCNSVTDEEPHRNISFGEWLEGREVRKLFADQYYSGKVTMFDKEAGWYRVVYEDGDFEDLEWNELEEVLLPLDVMIPLKTLAMKMLKKSLKPTYVSGGKRGHPIKDPAEDVKKKAKLSGGKRGHLKKLQVEKVEENAKLTMVIEGTSVEKNEDNAKLTMITEGASVEKVEEDGKLSGGKGGCPRKLQVEKVEENLMLTMITEGASKEKVEENGKPSGKKRGRPRKLQVEKVEENANLTMITERDAVEKVEDNAKLAMITEGASVQKVAENGKPSGRKRGRPRKIRVEKVEENAKLSMITEGASLEEVEEIGKSSGEKRGHPRIPQVKKVEENRKPSGGKRGRPRKIQVETVDENAKLTMVTEGASVDNNQILLVHKTALGETVEQGSEL